MKLAEDEVVCGICREIIKREDSKQFVESVEWGSLSGRNNYGLCCKSHKLHLDGTVPGKAYA